MKKSIVYGLGTKFEEMLWNGDLKNYNIIAYCDKDSSKYGTCIRGKKVISPEEIKNYDFDEILICTYLYKDEIIRYLVHELGIRESVIRCLDCGKSISELNYWKKIYENEGGHFENDHYRDLMLAIAEERDDSFMRGKIVADFGCGPRGSLAWTTEPKVKIGIDVLADQYLDFFGEEMLRHQMIYVTANESHIPIPDAYVDYICTINSLDHVNSLESMTGEILRILKPNGVLLASFNLNEPATYCEPQTLTEQLLEEKLLRYFDVVSYKLGYRAESGTYENMLNGHFVESVSENETAILWVKGRKK